MNSSGRKCSENALYLGSATNTLYLYALSVAAYICITSFGSFYVVYAIGKLMEIRLRAKVTWSSMTIGSEITNYN